MRWFVLVTLSFLLLSSCAVRRGPGARLGSGAYFHLNAGNAGFEPLALMHRFEITKHGKPFRFNGHVEWEPGRLAMVGLTPLGNRGFTAVWAPGTFSYEPMPFYRLPIRPVQLVAAYHLMYRQAASLREQLASDGLRLEESQNTRSVFKGRRLLIRIVYQERAPFSGAVHFAHIGKQYSLRIVTLAKQPLDPP